jgi:hypothetical protein
MNQIKLLLVVVVFVLATAGVLLSGCAGPKSTPDASLAPDQCVSPENLEQDIVSAAQLEAFTCSFKKWEGVETLHMKVVIKNVSDQSKRFRVNIFLDNGKAVGGLIPRRLKDGLVEPGQAGSFVYPVKDMPQKPKQIFLVIGTSGP